MSSPSSPLLVDVDLSGEMSPPAAWTPGKFLTGGECSVIDMNSPVYDPAMQVRGQGLLVNTSHVSQDVSFKPVKSTDNCGPLPRGTTYLIVACCVVASFALGLLAYIHL